MDIIDFEDYSYDPNMDMIMQDMFFDFGGSADFSNGASSAGFGVSDFDDFGMFADDIAATSLREVLGSMYSKDAHDGWGGLYHEDGIYGDAADIVENTFGMNIMDFLADTTESFDEVISDGVVFDFDGDGSNIDDMIFVDTAITTVAGVVAAAAFVAGAPAIGMAAIFIGAFFGLRAAWNAYNGET